MGVRPLLNSALGLAVVACCALAGCGTTKSRLATEQLLISDAVDRAIANIEFQGLAGQKVYLDTQYIEHIKASPNPNQGAGIINADYIISSVRQQMISSNVLVQDKLEDADYVVELRCGAIASDAHEVVYGIPANNAISNAVQLAPGAPAVPPIPEISLAKRNDTFGAAKIGVFAYHRQTREPVWQAGIAQARSTSKDVWLFGAGPLQRGSIYTTPRFAGNKIRLPLLPRDAAAKERDLVQFKNKRDFADPADASPKELHADTAQDAKSKQVSHEEQTAAPATTPAPAAEPPMPAPELLPTS